MDEHGSSIVSFGKLDNGTDREANGDTLFNVHSATGTFTHLLLLDMVERGEMKLDDPVAGYLPKSVKMPTYHGKEITLRHLVKETSGLPNLIGKLDPKRADNPFADFTVEKMYAFVSGCQLTNDPGTKHYHGGVDLGLLSQAMALKAGTDFESLMVDRIFRPLKMDSARFTLTGELKSRLASEHNEFGYARPSWDWGAMKPFAGLHSTANDLLKFVSALGLTPSGLTPLMEKSMTNLSYAPEIEGMIHTGGGGFGGRSYACFDKTRRRGVVILSTADDSGRELGNLLLESEWQSDRRPTKTNINSQVYGSYVGQYRRSPDFTLGMFVMRQYLRNAPKTAIFLPAAFCLAALVILLWRAGSFRKRWVILGCVVLVCGLLAPLLALVSSRVFCARFQPGIGIHREGDRLFAQATGLNLCPIEDWRFLQAWGSQSNPIDVLFPLVQAELLPESENCLFERLSGVPMTFSRDARGKVTGLTLHYREKVFFYEKISDEPPKAPEPPKRPVLIKLDTKLLDAVVGHYEFAPNAMFPTGMKLTIRREEDQLVSQCWGKNVGQGAFDIYPESETNFFLKIADEQFIFIKNKEGEVTAAIDHGAGFPDLEGKKLK
ncbi:MAG: serine hydrolase [Verrucomicrobiota bacterium]